MYTVENYIVGRWVKGDGDGQLLFNAVTGDPIAKATSQGIDFAQVVHYARNQGNTALRKMSFHERGLMLKALALHLREHLDRFYPISYQTGATKADSWVDIEGGIGNLFSYASLRRKFPDTPYCLDGEHHSLGKANTFM
ncbi:MAG: oxepin-CoA hydrolase / 3-oxo-5 6-dehydrosuberyl-CoA semialdehyde, partial [Chitinophagaceae bacterium]